MPQPTPGDVHVNAPLTNISVAYVQDQQDFIADRAFPIVPVEHQSDLYYIFNKEDFLRDEAKPRAPGTESAGGGFKVTTDSYACIVEAFHKDIDDQLRSNADSVLSLDTAAAEWVMQKMLIRRERRWVDNYFKTGIWTTDITPNPLWSAAPTGGSSPMKDLETGKMAIKRKTGYRANTLIVGLEVYSALRTNAAVQDQFKYTSADSIDQAMLARYFDIDQILISSAVYETTTEGNATPTPAFIAGKNALLCYLPPSPSLMTPSAGYTFTWRGFTGAINGIRTKRFRQENLASDRIEGEMAYAMKRVAADCGYFFSACVS